MSRGNAGVVGEKLWQGRTFVPDEVDLDTVNGERTGVILHAGTPPEIPYDDDGGAHVWIGMKNYYNPAAVPRATRTAATGQDWLASARNRSDSRSSWS